MQAGASLMVSRLFSRLTPEDIINGSRDMEAWIDRSVDISLAVRQRVREDSVEFYNEVRGLNGLPPFTPPPGPAADIEAMRTSFAVTGVVGARKRIEAIPVTSFYEPSRDTPNEHRNRQMDIIRLGESGRIFEALQQSGDAAGAAAGRHVANGGREQIIEAARADQRSVGWVRVTSSKPCFFCAALASRGPVYDEDSFSESDARFTGPGEVKVHDSCSCAMRQVYSRKPDQIPMLNIEMSATWEDLSRELGRAPTMLDWRRRYEGRARAA